MHAAGILYHSVAGEMYFLVYVHWCLQHPLIYKQVRYCNICSIIWLANFQLKFYIREFNFFIYRGWVIFFYNFLQWGVTNVSEKLPKVLPAHP